MTAQEDHRQQPGSSTPTSACRDGPAANDRIYGITEHLRPSNELIGAVAQVQKTARKVVYDVTRQFERVYQSSGRYSGVEVSMSRPRQVVVIGNLRQFEDNGEPNPEMVENFELFRTSLSDTEVITFDELYQRACFIVRDEQGEV